MNSADTNLAAADRFYAEIGKLVLEWGTIETGLDLCILVVNKLRDKPQDRGLYMPLTQKLRFLKQASHTIPSLHGHTHAIQVLLSNIETASGIRHDIVHGFVYGREIDSGSMSATLGRFLQN